MAPLTPTWICLSPAYDAPLSIPAALCFAGKSWSFKSEHQICTVWVVNYVFLMTFNSHFCCLAVSLLLSKSRFRKLSLTWFLPVQSSFSLVYIRFLYLFVYTHDQQ